MTPTGAHRRLIDAVPLGHTDHSLTARTGDR